MWRVLMVVVTGCLAVATASVLRLKSAGPKYKDCGSKGGYITSLDIEPCGETGTCMFPHGSNITVKLGFKSEEQISNATTKVYGIIAGVPVPFPLPEPDACKDMKCPVNKGSDVLYNNVIPVKSTYPKIRLVVKWEIIDVAGDGDIICFEVPAEITG